jgi:hypothetical protein
MVSLQGLEAQYRALIVLMEQSEAAIARHDLEAVEAHAHGTKQAVAELARASAELKGLGMMPGEGSAWESIADAMQQALTRTDQNCVQIQHWIGQIQDVLSHMRRGGRAVNVYATAGMPDGAEFLSAKG